MKGLICVAHPDDETLFFGGLVLENPDIEWTVVCVTDGNGSGTGPQRSQEFSLACSSLGVKHHTMLNFPDIFDQRIEVNKLISLLRAQYSNFDIIYTHGILGEYGHPHHQDVSFAVHRAFADKKTVWSVAICLYPDVRFPLSFENFERKTQILAGPYRTETQKFLNLIPATSAENFARLTLEEVEHLYQFFTSGSALEETKMGRHAWLHPYLVSQSWSTVASRFFGVYFAPQPKAIP